MELIECRCQHGVLSVCYQLKSTKAQCSGQRKIGKLLHPSHLDRQQGNKPLGINLLEWPASAPLDGLPANATVRRRALFAILTDMEVEISQHRN